MENSLSRYTIRQQLKKLLMYSFFCSFSLKRFFKCLTQYTVHEKKRLTFPKRPTTNDIIDFCSFEAYSIKQFDKNAVKFDMRRTKKNSRWKERVC